MDKEIRYFVNGWSFRLSFATRPGYDGDHEDISDGDSYELGEYENSEEALAAAEAFISTHGNEVNDEEDGIGSVIYWTVEVERRVEYKENEWLPCDESGRIDDGYGNEPNATVAYLSSLEGSREERAFELAKNEYLAWLEHKADRYTTVYWLHDDYDIREYYREHGKHSSLAEISFDVFQEMIRCAREHGIEPMATIGGAEAVSKRVRCIETGKEYRSIQDAADDVQRSRASLSSAIKRSGTCAGCHWALV